MTAALASIAVLSMAGGHTQAELANRYAAWDQAYLKHDVVSQANLLHPSFRIVTGSGKIIKRPDYVRSLWKGKSPERYQTTILRVERKGLRAFAWTKEISKHAREEEHVHRYRDTWLNTAGHWKLTESKTLGED
jgi:hypothetical protein